jgi:hypothetical protein
MVIDQVHNDGVTDLFRNCPYVTRHLHVVQLPQHQGYENFDYSLIPSGTPAVDQYPHWQSYPEDDPTFTLSEDEERDLQAVLSGGRPVIVIQPFAGLPHRDAFNEPSLTQMVYHLDQAGYKIVIIGRDHGRLGAGRQQHVNIHESAHVVNLINRVGLRFTWHLVNRCAGYIGAHSAFILPTWYWNKPNALVIPWPSLQPHWDNVDRKYMFGLGRDNTLVATYKAEGMDISTWDYMSLDYNNIVEHFNSFVRPIALKSTTV